MSYLGGEGESNTKLLAVEISDPFFIPWLLAETKTVNTVGWISN